MSPVGVVCVFVVACGFTSGAAQITTERNFFLNGTQKEALREAVAQILDIRTEVVPELFKFSNKPVSDAAKDVEKKAGNFTKEKKYIIPKHMLELYERYESGKIATGETIRSFEPIADFAPYMKDILVFNMSTIDGQDKIRTSQLHIHRRRLTQHQMHLNRKIKLPPCKVKLYEVILGSGTGNPAQAMIPDAKDIKTKLISLDAVALSQVSKGGWHSLEISMALKQSLNSVNSLHGPLLGVRFEGPKGRTISASHFLKQPSDETSSAFVVVFSEGTNKSTFNNSTPTVNITEKHVAIIDEILKHNEEKIPLKGVSKSDLGYKSDSNDNLGTVEESEVNRIADKEYIPEPAGFGDIIELTRFTTHERYPRRHNHKKLNSLKVRYDTETNKLIQSRKKDGLGKIKRFAHFKDVNSQIKHHKSKRSILDNELPQLGPEDVTDKRKVIAETELIKEIEEISRPKNIHTDNIKINRFKDKDSTKEDDMGDVVYYEPDVYIHEKLVPKKYRSRYDDMENDQQSDYNDLESKSFNPTSIIETTPTEELVDNRDQYVKKNKWIDSDDDFDDNIEIKTLDKENNGYMKNLNYDLYRVNEENSRKRHQSQRGKARRGRKRKHHKTGLSNDWSIWKKKLYSQSGPAVLKKFPSPSPPSPSPSPAPPASPCSLHELNVNFAEIGLGDWILAPDSMAAGYCAGSCDLMNVKGPQATNHAVIQSFVRAVRADTRVPAACCAPARTAPLSVLVRDRAGNVVLRNYKDMLVEACQCQ